MIARVLVVVAALAASARADDPPSPAAPITELVIELSLAHVPGIPDASDSPPKLDEDCLVRLDGGDVQLLARHLRVLPGPHHLEVGVPGYFAVRRDVNAVAGESVHVEVELVARPIRIAFASEPGTHIAVDGQLLHSQFLLPGHHVVAAVRRGRQLGVREIVLRPGDPDAGNLVLVLAPSMKRRAVPWVAGGAGVLALTAIGTMIGAVVEQGDAEAIRDKLGTGNLTPTQGTAYNADVHARDDLRATALATAAGSLVALGVAAALYWFDLPDLKRAGLVPVGPAGVGWQARF